ncbi:PEP-utilizing enzyme [Ilumatobacter sp.]|uniref:PEP-utilizing enzyme n=1 Tax=Ilumatobacter sp. TaxID=1967498 RepID=UPI003C6A9BC2
MTDIRWIEDNVFNPKLPLWTRANVGEVLPDPPSPLAWDLVFETGSVLGWRDCMINRLGIAPDEVDEARPEVMGLFGGYAYLGTTILRVWAERTPGFCADDLDAAYFAGHPDVPPYVAERWHENAATTEVMTGWLGWVMGDRSQDELEADRRRTRAARDERPDLSALTDVELFERARSFVPMIRDLFNQHINQSGAASIGPGVIGAVCAAVGNPGASMHLIAGIGGVDSAAPSFAMWDLSREVVKSETLTDLFDGGTTGLTSRIRESSHPDVVEFVGSLDAFLVEFGSRGPNEWDVHSPSWECDPDLVLALVDRMRGAEDTADPHREQAARQAERERLGTEITEALAGDAEAQGQFVAALASSATFLPGRERSKTNVIRVIGEVRMALWEIGRRAVERGEMDRDSDVCLLFVDEVERLIDGSLDGPHDLVERRLAHLHWLEGLQPPFIFTEPPPPNTEWPERGSNTADVSAVGDVLTGLPGCPGSARGRAVVVLHPSDPGDLGQGDILVAPMTDPSWTPLFVPAAAVVVDVGAPLSHAIIVSRELGIPCVVSVNEATERIPNGATIEVNGETGTVTVVALP